MIRSLPTPFLDTIKGKIFLLFAATFLTACVLTLLNVSNLTVVRQGLLTGERYGDLLNDILEVRRYEKNYLFYGDQQSLTEGVEYLDRLDRILAELAPDIKESIGPGELARLQSTLSTYRALMGKPGGPQNLEAVRMAGKALVDQVEAISRTKRARIHRTLRRTALLPFAYLGVFLVFMVGLIKVIANQLLRPLSQVGKLTARVARGDFRPLDVPGRHIGEVSGLLEALNRMARELEANQQELLQAGKIAALGTFTAGIAHEINNPINNILLSAETLLEVQGDALDDDAREIAEDIMGQAERAGEIVRNLLDFSRTERPVFSRLEPSLIVRSTVGLFKNQLLVSGVNLAQDVEPGLPLVDGDLRSLQQVLLNLLVNAAQATDAGGRIALAARRENGWVRLEVSDTGKGISPEDLEHIYEPFFTTKEVGQGTGLGLAISYSIVRRHGGRMDVRSQPGQGATFAVLLPVAGEKREEGEEN